MTEIDIEQFVHEGFVRIDAAFPTETAIAAREILWRNTGCNPSDRSTWTKPVIRLWDYPQEPFRQAANTLVLHRAYDALVGKDRWVPPERLGSFPIRFPHRDDPGDTGWHVDSSFPPDPPVGNDYLRWRINVRSKGRALLMLFLFSDVDVEDAPTRVRIGSHLEVAQLLDSAGEDGLSTMELAMKAAPATIGMKETIAIEMPARYISAIHFCCILHNSTAAARLAFWRNRHCFRVSPSNSRVQMATTRR